MRFVLILILISAALYFAVRLFWASTQTERWEDIADERIANGTLASGAREDYIEQQRRSAKRSILWRMMWMVAAIPVGVVAALIFVMNF